MATSRTRPRGAITLRLPTSNHREIYVERDEAAALMARLHQTQGQFYAGGDDTAVRQVLAPDIAWHVPGDNAIAGDYQGIEDVLAYFRRRRDLAGSTMRMHLRELLVGADGHIAAITDGTATLDGEEYAWSTIGLYRIHAERIAECWLLPFDQAAFDAIWARRSPTTGSTAEVPVSVFATSVRPRHCDAQGMLHASRYYEYFEDAFLHWLDVHIEGYAVLRSAGTDLVVVASGCEHRRGAALNDRLEIEVRATSAGRTSLSVTFTVRREQDIIAVGHTTYVAVAAAGAVPLPEPLRALANRC